MNEKTGEIREAGEPPKLDENLIPIGRIVHLPKIGWFEIQGVRAEENQVILKGIPEPPGLRKPYRGPPRNRAERRRAAHEKAARRPTHARPEPDAGGGI